jgi:hypothetical protein
MSGERLAMGPLHQRDIEHLVAVLLRGLQRQTVPTETGSEETAPLAETFTSPSGAHVETAPHARFVGPKRKPATRRATARRQRR